MRALTLSLLLIIAPTQIHSDSKPSEEFIVWNVGQGLWTSWLHNNECWHFDMGGEYKKIISRVTYLCAPRLNRIFLSHWDMDHVGFVKVFRKRVPNICLAQSPGGTPSPQKIQIIEGLRLCPKITFVRNLWDATNGDPQLKLKSKNRSNNHDSHVFELIRLGILVTGDSTVDEEKIWRDRASPQIKGLVLGHHGSHTSTSDLLLQRLPHLRWAVASQRYRRYGHPHKVVVERLAKRKIPLLKTEDWGTLHFQQMAK